MGSSHGEARVVHAEEVRVGIEEVERSRGEEGVVARLPIVLERWKTWARDQLAEEGRVRALSPRHVVPAIQVVGRRSFVSLVLLFCPFHRNGLSRGVLDRLLRRKNHQACPRQEGQHLQHESG